MATEIERKFLINSDLLRQSEDLVSAKRYHIRQAYLSQGGHSSAPANTVRVRIVEAQAYLTIKGPATGITRAEFEYAIPVTDAEQLLTLCTGHVISKTRYLLPLAGHLWEVDEFHGVHQGLWLAEIELAAEHDSFSKPQWLGREVSHDHHYQNSSLAQSMLS